MAVVRESTQNASGGWDQAFEYFATDHLGTVRFSYKVDASGTLIASSTHDYEPFGLEIGPIETSDNTHRFTGHERDAETGNDYMHYRFYGNSIGRFMKPDNVTGAMQNPQGWNLYSYVHGNPVNFNDPTGHMGGQPYGIHSWAGGNICGGSGVVVDTGPSGLLPALPTQGWASIDASMNPIELAMNMPERVIYSLVSVAKYLGRLDAMAKPGWTCLTADNPVVDALEAAVTHVEKFPVAVSGKGGPHRTILITYSNGMIEKRSGGTLNWRTNNPGNIKIGEFSKRHGAIGHNGTFAIFPSGQAGRQALKALLGISHYQRSSVNDMVATYAPPCCNPTKLYQSFISNQVSVPGSTTLNSLTAGQMDTLMDSITRFEGGAVPGNISVSYP